MASPVALGDIVNALKLIKWIKETCFNPENDARIGYQQFSQDVADLEYRLREFQEAFTRATAQLDHHAPRPRDRVTQLHSRRQAADTYVGDFLATLEECKTLLRDTSRTSNRHGGRRILDNVFWGASTHPRVDSLRTRIRAHTEKIALLMAPVRLQLATDTAVTVDELLEIVLVSVGLVKVYELPDIPSEIESKLKAALRRQAAIQIADTSTIPVGEGVNMMIFHFEEAKIPPIGSVEAQRQHKDLHLLKAHWLAKLLSRSRTLEAFGPGHRYRQDLRKTKQAIAQQYTREGAPSYNHLLDLDVLYFVIGPMEEAIPEPSLTKTQDGEGLLVRLPLCSAPHEEKEVFVFRASDQGLRIVSVFTPTDPSRRGVERHKYFDLNSDRLVPLYTIASGKRREWSIEMVYANGAPQDNFPFRTRSDAFEFHRAVTRYETKAFSEHVSCTTTYKKFLKASLRDPQEFFSGEIQLLQWHLPNPSTPVTVSPLRNRSIASCGYRSSYAAATQTFKNVNPQLTSIYEAEDGKTTVTTALPPSPLIIGIDQNNETYRFWKIELDHVEMEESAEGGSRLAFTAINTSNTFPLKALSVHTKPALKYWDLGALLANREIIADKKDKSHVETETLNCTNLALSFPNLKAREEFHLELLKVKKHRLSEHNDAKTARVTAKSEMLSSTSTLPLGARSLWRGPASSLLSTTSFLPPLSRVSTFDMDTPSSPGRRQSRGG